MVVTIEEKSKSTEQEVLIRCICHDREIDKLRDHILSFEERLTVSQGKKRILLMGSQILYMESVDKKTFVYDAKEMYETEYRLYELEDMLKKQNFIRISKAVIVNFSKIVTIRPNLNRTLEITLENYEKLHVSRQYAVDIRNLLGIGR